MLLGLTASLLLSTAAIAQDTPEPPAAQDEAKEPTGSRAKITQTTAEAQRVYDAGPRDVNYTVKAGFLPLGPEGEPEVEIFHVAYTENDVDAGERPVTFVFNGGPGAASVYLHMGALGPVRLKFTEDGKLTPPPTRTEANPDSWLPYTDLVFIDPVGTGFSRFVGEAAEGEGRAKAESKYLSVDGDLTAVGDFIERWLAENNRYRSPIVVAGESYGGFRAAALAQTLPKQHNVPLSGSVMISPKFDLFGGRSDMLHPAPWLTRVPSYAATAAAQGKGPSGKAVTSMEGMEDLLEDAELFAVSDFARYLVQGERMEDEEQEAILSRFATLTGLDEAYVMRQRGRVQQDEFARELLRDEGELLGIYDATVTGIDPAPDEAQAGYSVDPTLAVLSGPYRAALISFLGEELGFSLPDRSYEPLSYETSGTWRYFVGSPNRPSPPAAAEGLREGLALNEHLKVWITHGAMDLQTPYYESAYIIDNLGIPDPVRDNVRLNTYYGGHMYYMHPQSSEEFADDAEEFYEAL